MKPASPATPSRDPEHDQKTQVAAAGDIMLLSEPDPGHTLFAGKRVGANYWGAGATTLEWTVSSPPPFHTFEQLLVVK